ncbi:neuropeptide Y receptor type 2-like [Heptranchias perlo]|uniref:neuropeptide Y receptor type 2-like n=1 Tax=Heptranchias perlo TaxID=212740 RepID=UPI00355A162B
MGPLESESGVNITEEREQGAEMDLKNREEDITPPFNELYPPDFSINDSTKLLGVQITLILAYCSIIVLGVVGNSLVIYVVIKYKNMGTVTNFFIVNLAVADLMVNTMCLPFTLVYTLLGEWKFGSVLCHLLPYAQALSVHVSTVTLTVIALDRHRCIVYHLESKISKKRCFIIISITWLVSAVLACPQAIFREYSAIEFDDLRMQVCSEKWPNGNDGDGTLYSVSMLLLQYVLPLVIICYAYIRIWTKLKNHVSPGGGNDRQLRRRKTTKMLVMVVVAFAVSWLPFHVFQLAIDIDKKVLDLNEYKLLYTIFHVIAMCSTFVNPLVYGWMNKNYRNSFLTVFKCEQRLDSIHPEGTAKFKTKERTELKENTEAKICLSSPGTQLTESN